MVFVGKTSFPEIDAGINRYVERLRHYAPTRIHIVRAEKIGKKASEDKIREIEGERILKLVGASGHLLVWDQRGRQLDSIGFARFLEKIRNQGMPDLWMVIGGPLGTAPALLERANSVLSLSRLTFPHDLARLVIAEQLYRGFCILDGTPYHK
ncbi:MAG: 23S rRNA (pseudouridine(1915)-N(3))-methyltransferase RlmH [Desulfoferrobacter sp.]